MASGKYSRSSSSSVSEPDFFEYMGKYEEGGYILKPEDKTVCRKFVPRNEEISAIYHTPIVDLVSSQELPILVQVQESYASRHYGISLKKGDIMILHFIVRAKRVFAIDEHNKEVVLPIYAKQLYEVLPIDPAHDDKIFHGTAEVIQSKPLPKRVRIIDAFFSDVPEESQEVGDIIEISHIEKRPGTGKAKVLHLVGRCAKSRCAVAYSENINAVYTTMLTDNSHTLSEIVRRFPLPMRIRKVGEKQSIFYLNECKEESQVLCTHSDRKQLMSLPLTANVLITYVSSETMVNNVLGGLLPQLYPHINWSWGVPEIGRVPLPTALEEIPVPILEVMTYWLQSKEGRALIERITEGSSKSKNVQIDDLTKEIQQLKRTSSQETYSKPSIPPRKPPLTKSRTFSNIDRKAKPVLPIIVPKPRSDIIKLKTELIDKQKEIDNLKEENKKLKQRDHEVNVLEKKIAFQTTRIQELQKEVDQEKAPRYVEACAAPSYEIPKETFTFDMQNGSIDDVATFLVSIGLSSYEEQFRNERIDVPLLMELDADILLQDLNMSKLHAKRLQIKLEQIRKNNVQTK